METVRNYLESMFSRLPNTGEVLRAKCELGQMMEDKYNELIEDGKSENEAVGIVISEFGNLDELAQTLGLGTILESGTKEGQMVGIEEVKEYLVASRKAVFQKALGTFLAIICVTGIIFCGCLTEEYPQINEDRVMLCGILFLIFCITVAVVLNRYSKYLMDKWSYLYNQPCSIDYATAEYVSEQRENERINNAVLKTIGVVCLCLCAVPIFVTGMLDIGDFISGVGVVLMLFLIGIGVFMVLVANGRENGFLVILGLNDRSTVGGNFVRSQKEVVYYSNKTVEDIMSVYWPTVRCLYLIWSFLTFGWYYTWIIWPVAAIIEKIVKMNFGNGEVHA